MGLTILCTFFSSVCLITPLFYYKIIQTSEERISRGYLTKPPTLSYTKKVFNFFLFAENGIDYVIG